MTDTPRWREAIRKRRNLLVGGAVAVAAVGGLYMATHSEEKEAPQTAEQRAQAVTVTRAEERAFARTLTLSGEARPRIDVRVFAPATGVRVVQLLADEGDYVKAGQPLARLDVNLASAQTLAAQAAVKEAEVAAQRAQAEFKRADSIRDSGALSAEAIETRRAQAEAAQAQLSARKAQLAEVNARLQGGYIRAPQAGLVLDRTAQVGALVDGQSLFRIAADNALEIGVEVSESDMLSMKRGQAARFQLVDGSTITGKLRRGPASIDSRTRTGEAVFDLPRDAKLRAGMFLRGEAKLPTSEQLAVPQSAVVFDAGAAFVFVVDANNTARRTKVVAGDRDGNFIAIREGLSAGVRVASGGAAFLQDGDIVRPVEAASGAPPAASASTTAMGG